MRRPGWLAAALVAALAAALARPSPASGQQVQLDEPVRAGPLTLFPSVQAPSRFYYVPAYARLARNADGRPQFSLLRYVQNVASGPGEDERGEGEGGGILHAVVELGATDPQREEARAELRRLRPGAELAGPVIFRSGKFGLVSTFADASGNLTEKVVGVGAAPILDGSKAAVSLRLTRLGAQILWQSFQSATPDLSFQFEMEMAGYRAPMRAVLEADFERIYAHEDFDVAAATPLVATEIRQTFDELRNEGAIKLELVGENQKLREMIDYAYRKISDIMFQPVGGGTGTPEVAQLQGRPGGSLLDKATQRLAAARKEARESNAKLREERRKIRAAHAKQLEERSRALGSLLKQAQGAQIDPQLLEIVRAESAYADVLALGAQDRSDVDLEAELAALPEEEALPEFSALAVYELRRSRRSDKYRLDLNQSLPDTLPIVFSENIGDLSRYLADERVFRNVNLDDPLYQQREIAVFLSGAGAQDFDQYLSFVAVEMRKRHESGEETTDELRIDRKSFNAEGNRFTLLYGWKGDADRRAWARYEWRALWSFADGSVVEEPWREASFASIALTPPRLPHVVTLESLEPERLRQAGVRAVTVSFFSPVAAKEPSARATLRVGSGVTSGEAAFLLPRGEEQYGYEIQWLLPGNRTLSSGRQSASFPVLSVDELPEG